MKKVLVLLVAAVFTLVSANAQTENDLVISAGDAKEITLGENMNVVLVVAEPGAGNVILSKEVLEKLDVKFSGKSLQIAPNKNLHSQTVYVLVNGLKQVTLGENTSVTNRGCLPAGQLDVFINNGASATLRTNGRIDAYSLGEYDVTIKRTPVQSQGSSASIM